MNLTREGGRSRLTQWMGLGALSVLAACGGGGNDNTSVTTGGGGDSTNASTVVPTDASKLPPITSGADAAGGSASSSSSSAAYPASGRYAVVLKPQGDPALSKMTLSLVHPDDPSVEYVIESTPVIVVAGEVIEQGQVDPLTWTVSQRQSHTLVYVADGQLRSVRMVADGTAPLASRHVSAFRDVCDIDAVTTDYVQPANTRLQFRRSGADGVCGTRDDLPQWSYLGQAGFVDGAITNLNGSPSANRLMGFLRNAGNPNELYQPLVAAPSSDALTPLSQSATTLVFDREMPSGEHALMLTGWVSNGAGTAPSSLSYGSATVSALPWSVIGQDADAVYAYGVPAGNFDGPQWRVLRLSKTTATVTVLAAGGGQISSATLTSNRIFLVANLNGVGQLMSLDKTQWSFPRALDSVTAGDSLALDASMSGVLALSRTSTATSVNSGRALAFRAETDAGPMLRTSESARLMGTLDAPTLNLAGGNNTQRFYFATPLSPSVSFAGASIVEYDSVSLQRVTVGGLPTFGGRTAVSYLSETRPDFAVGYVTPVAAGLASATEGRVYSFRPGQANSLRWTTTLRQ